MNKPIINNDHVNSFTVSEFSNESCETVLNGMNASLVQLIGRAKRSGDTVVPIPILIEFTKDGEEQD